MSAEGAIEGIYATFESFPGINLALERLDPRQGKTHPELMSVQKIDIGGGAMMERATVFIPQGKINYFLDRITQYLDTVDKDKPRNRELVDRIQAVRAASIEALWTDPPQEFPSRRADRVVGGMAASSGRARGRASACIRRGRKIAGWTAESRIRRPDCRSPPGHRGAARYRRRCSGRSR